jgi:hypothetical protein
MHFDDEFADEWRKNVVHDDYNTCISRLLGVKSTILRSE